MDIRPAFVLIMLSVVALTGCYSSVTPHREVKMRVVTDDLGRRVELLEEVDDVVSLDPGITEIIFAVGAGKKLVGVTSACDHPSEARSISKVGAPDRPNIETVIAMKPQVVFAMAASLTDDAIKKLEEKEIKAFVIDPKTLEDVYASIEKIGEALGEQMDAANVVDEMKTKAVQSAARFRPHRPTVFVQIAREPLETAGRDSFITDVISKAGGISATGDMVLSGRGMSRDAAGRLDPDVIVIAENENNREPNETFRNSKAVKNRRIVRIDAKLLLRPGPRLADAIDMLAKQLEQAS